MSKASLVSTATTRSVAATPSRIPSLRSTVAATKSTVAAELQIQDEIFPGAAPSLSPEAFNPAFADAFELCTVAGSGR